MRNRMNAVVLAACTAAALATTPLAAQRPEGSSTRADRLTLETFLEMETVSDPQPDPIYTRLGGQDERPPRVCSLDHERRRLAEPFPGEGIQCALVAIR